MVVVFLCLCGEGTYVSFPYLITGSSRRGAYRGLYYSSWSIAKARWVWVFAVFASLIPISDASFFTFRVYFSDFRYY